MEITRRCNLTCPHCYTAATRKSISEFTTGEYCRLIDELADLGTDMIGWTGGEPLLRNDLVQLIDYAGRKGIQSGITTNGVLLDRTLAQRLKEVNIKVIQISLDGSTSEKNEQMRRTDSESYDKIIAAIRVCRDLKIRVNLAMVLGRETLNDAASMLKLAQREGVEAVRFCGFVPQGRGKRKNVVDKMMLNGDLPQLRSFVEQTMDQESTRAIYDPAIGPLPPDYRFHQCMAGVSTCYISCTGDVYPCTSLLNERFKVGNIRANSITELWNDPRITEIAHFKRDQIIGACSVCPDFPNCRGACRGITYAHTGDLNASFPVCIRVNS